MATIDDFARLELRVGRITNVEDVEGARKPLYKLTIDFGPEVGLRTVVAGIKDRYSREELLGRQIACVVNLDPKSIAGIASQGMVLAAEDEGSLSLLGPDKELVDGSRIH